MPIAASHAWTMIMHQAAAASHAAAPTGNAAMLTMALIVVTIAQTMKGRVMIGSVESGMRVEHAACGP